MKILIIGPSWVGDMVMAQTLFITLQQLHPELTLDVLAPEWCQPLLERMPEVRRSINMPVGHGKLALAARYRLGKSLRTENYQQAIVLPNSFKSALIPLFARIPVRTGWRGELRGWLLNDCRLLDKQQYPLMIQRFIALAYPANKTLPERLPYPRFSQASDNESLIKRLGLARDREVIVLCPGAEFGSSKQWPAEYYAAVASNFIAAGKQVWILGSANDKAVAEQITGNLDAGMETCCFNLAGATALNEAIDLMSMAGLVISNDSGLMHMAAALNKPLVVLYGSTSPEFTPPLGNQVKIVSSGIECSPCFKRECPLGHHKCMRDILPDTLIMEAQGVMERLQMDVEKPARANG